jgi:predicted signal transduction protein with EAL and GGDEF domain
VVSRLTPILLGKALRAAETWPDDISLAFNLSPLDITSNEAMLKLIAMVGQTSVSPGRIIFEVTEGAVIRNLEVARKNIAMLRNLGVRVALDDFGTGYSSLNHVSKMPLDRLKIDRSFVDGLETEKETRDVVRTIADLCRNLDLDCVVEGVETAAQLERLEDMGLRLVQGFHFSRPIPAADVSDFLSRPLAPERAKAPEAVVKVA